MLSICFFFEQRKPGKDLFTVADFKTFLTNDDFYTQFLLGGITAAITRRQAQLKYRNT